MIEALPEGDVWWTANGTQMCWNNKNLHRFMPTVNVYREGAVRELEVTPDPRIGNALVDLGEGRSMSLAGFLDSDLATTMSLVVVKDGKIVHEQYPKQEAWEKPIVWSVTKVLVSAVVAILEDEGRVVVDDDIDKYLPRLSTSSFAGTSVRNLLDMATGLSCEEDYSDPRSCYYQLAVTLGDGYYTADDPDNPYDVLASMKLERFAPAGTSYAYSSVNTFILGWLVEEVTGMPFQDALSHYIWRRIGAEHDASILAPRFGVPITYGGFMATPRDIARFGLLYTPSRSVVASAPVLPEGHARFLADGGRPELMANAKYGAPADEVDHNVYQWDLVFDNNDMFKGGWAGQGLMVNPDKDLVVVFTGYLDDTGEATGLLPILRGILNEVYPGPDQSGGADSAM